MYRNVHCTPIQVYRGCWIGDVKEFVREIGRILRETQTGCDPRAGNFLALKLSIVIQRGNAASLMDTLTQEQPGGISLMKRERILLDLLKKNIFIKYLIYLNM